MATKNRLTTKTGASFSIVRDSSKRPTSTSRPHRGRQRWRCLLHRQRAERRVLGERRLRALRDLGAGAALVGVGGVERYDLTPGRDSMIADVSVLAAAREGRAAEVETGASVSRAPATSAKRVLVLPISSGTQIVGAMVAGVSRLLRPKPAKADDGLSKRN